MALPNTLNFYTYEQLSTYTYEELDGTRYFSVRTAVTYDRSVVGRVSPFNVCNVEFDATDDIEAWECRATLDGQPYGVGVGLLMQGGGAVAGGTVEQFSITNTQLDLGEGKYRISVYVKKNNIWYGGE